MPARAKFMLRVTGVCSTDVKGGEVRYQLGNPDDEEGGVDADAPGWGADGFVGRPNPPSQDGHCLALFTYYGAQKYVLQTKDNRFKEKVGALDPGDRAVITDAEARWFLKQKSSAIVSYTVNQKTQDAMVIDHNGKDGAIRIMNGLCGLIIENTEDGRKLTITTGETTILLDPDGCFIFGPHLGANTNGGNFGTLGPIPPIAPAFSVLVGPTGMAGQPSLKWTMVVS